MKSVFIYTTPFITIIPFAATLHITCFGMEQASPNSNPLTQSQNILQKSKSISDKRRSRSFDSDICIKISSEQLESIVSFQRSKTTRDSQKLSDTPRKAEKLAALLTKKKLLESQRNLLKKKLSQNNNLTDSDTDDENDSIDTIEQQLELLNKQINHSATN